MIRELATVDLAQRLSEGQSRDTTQAIVAHIGDDPTRFAALFKLLQCGDFRMQQCAAWPISVVAEDNPQLVEPYLAKLLVYLKRDDVHDAVKRSVVRLLQYVDIPKRRRGEVFALCTDLLDDPSETVAVRAFALTVAERIAGENEELKNELRLILRKHLPQATAAMRVRSRRLLSGR